MIFILMKPRHKRLYEAGGILVMKCNAEASTPTSTERVRSMPSTRKTFTPGMITILRYG